MKSNIIFAVPAGARELVGDGSWKKTFRPYLKGANLCADGVRATYFGGVSDEMDSGITASGINTAAHPEILGCALPFRLSTRSGAFGPTLGSPIPHLLWNTLVKITAPATGKVITVPLIDIGPNKRTGNGLDLTEAAVQALGLRLADGAYRVNFEILGAALLIPPLT